jgi:hypothetical protein
VNQPVVLLVQLNVRNMEEGKIATAWTVWCDERSPSMYIRMRVLPWVTLLLAWGRLGSISAPFGEPASRFTSAIERSGIWKKVR